MQTENGNVCIKVMTGQYLKMTKPIPTPKTKATHAASVFLGYWISPYSIPGILPTDNDPPFVSKFFAIFSGFFGLEYLTASTYQIEINGEVQRYNKTIVARSRNYVAEQKDKSEIFVQPLTYTYSTQLHRSTGVCSFSLILS